MIITRTLLLVISMIFLACVAFVAQAWTPVPVADDPLLRMPGTQPNQATIDSPRNCLNCHGGYDQQVEPGFNWKGSMMAQSARDPIFWACVTVAAQDSIWALGNPNAVDLCERCHFPEGWLEGRSDPTNASLMAGSDYDGLHCDFCHKIWDPFFETTYNGTREGSDWIGYWDEAGPLSQPLADDTYVEDRAISAIIKLFSGADFFDKFFVPAYSGYTENASGQFFVSPNGGKRASFADAGAKHVMWYSRHHKSKYFCGTCHDVSNPVLANLGASGLPDQSGGVDLITEQYSASNYFHVERTFSEFMLSAYGQQGGAATNPEFLAQTGGISWADKCQDCHMSDLVGVGCNKNSGVLRPTESSEHPNSGLPFHDLTGGNAWISYILASLDSSGPVYDPFNLQLLDQGPSVLTLDLSAGETPKNEGAALKDGSDRAKDQLQLAATIKNVDYNYSTGELSFRIQNNTGHKLISGFPEGRRMFMNIKAYSGGSLIYEGNPYDYSAGTLKGLPGVAGSPALAAHEKYIDTVVYEAKTTSALTGEQKTFHFVLATGRYKDNRIPPKGFDVSGATARICAPVWHGADAPNYFTAEEYAGGYDDVSLTIAPGADNIELSLYYQGTSREYIKFLKDEINGTATTLAAPTPAGDTESYIVQTDGFFSQLKEWGNVIWDLWHHNHGLDGVGTPVAGIVPYEMADASWTLRFLITSTEYTAGGEYKIHFLSQPGSTYTISYCDDMNDTHGFVPFANNGSITAGSSSSTFTDDFTSNTSGGPSLTGCRFYRIAY